MKKLYILVIFFLTITANSQIINIPDPNFKTRLLLADSSNNIAKNLVGNYFKIDANNDGEIQFTEATQVSCLYIRSVQPITSVMGIEYFTAVIELDCGFNSITQLDVTNLTQLVKLDCRSNQISLINVTGLANLNQLHCSYNQITNLNLAGLTNLVVLHCESNQFNSLNVNGLIQLQDLNCRGNNLNSIDLTGLYSLTQLDCTNNQISTLNFDDVTILLDLYCGDNQLTSLDVSGQTQLSNLGFEVNQITSIDLTNNTLLQSLYFPDNLISNIDLSSLSNSLVYMDCSNNLLTSINLSNLSQLSAFQCVANQITTLDMSGLTLLNEFYIDSNPLLTSINVKNGSLEISEFIDFSNNPSLEYICADENQIQDIINKVNEYGYTNCQVNSYCSFTPGGDFYSISGSQRLDSDANGCDSNDLIFPSMKFSITDGITSGTVISDDSGNYSIPVQDGSHTINPVFENPNYFTVTPTTATITFPVATSPAIQDFCITANGVHNDLEITLIPIDIARPGFNANYKIIYKNKGTVTQSATINIVFNDVLMDFVSANPIILNQTVNNLTWSFTNLEPFESREIDFMMNLNSPTETPALNSGDVLHYTVSISASIDETPLDNIFTLNQTVYNSFDPNDKTCLEGATITPEKVGDYVHYLIRFENTGTANAQNIVVKDMIDTTKFDVSTLVPINGSHSFVTRITNPNKVEFIFENIQLPFDDANNDGYVAFKIKTKSTLTTGSSFSNTASIYFDYNFPIVTNTATTTIQALANQDFEFSNYFELAPNPAKNVLNIQTKNEIELSSISIYNTLGQLVMVITNAKETNSIDVSQLTAGTYFIKVISDKGSSNSKFVKD